MDLFVDRPIDGTAQSLLGASPTFFGGSRSETQYEPATGGKGEVIDKILEIISICDTPQRAEERLREIDGDIVEEEGFEELLETVENARMVGDRNPLIDLSIVRGIDYYDGVVFEVKSLDAPELGSLAGGGAFTSLVDAIGGNFTAFGVAGGIERTILALEKTNLLARDRGKKGLFIASTTDDARSITLEVVRKLRDTGVSIDHHSARRKLKGQLKYAEKMGFRYVVIVGEEEWRRGEVILKDFETEKQEPLPLAEVIEKYKP